MAAANKVPDNLNYLSNISFRLTMEDAPNLTWFCQAANVPGVSIPNNLILCLYTFPSNLKAIHAVSPS